VKTTISEAAYAAIKSLKVNTQILKLQIVKRLSEEIRMGKQLKTSHCSVKFCLWNM